MNNDDSRSNGGNDKSRSAPQPKDSLDSVPGSRREPVFTDFDDDEDYEEADRDTDYNSAYEEESDEDEYLPSPDEEAEDTSAEWQVLGATGAAAGRAGKNPWDVADSAGDSIDDIDSEYDDYDPDSHEEDTELADDRIESDLEQYEPEPEPEMLEAEPGQEWAPDEDYPDEAAEQEEAQSWPLGLIIVGIVALVLLAAGGYGVIQQRSATQEEIRQLQATLATAASPADVAASREALREIEQRNESLEATIDRLSLENRRLTDTVAGLEKQLAAQLAATKAVAEKTAAAKPVAAPKPKPASAAASGDWFVNFSSYSQRSVAQSWAKKLQPSAGKAVVATSTRDGKTFYRVRIIGLADRAAARKVAGQLESAYKLPPLWVGSE